MCGIYSNPNEIARSLTVAAAEKIVINPAGKSVEESNIELGRQLALVYKTILSELTRGDEDTLLDLGAHSHEHEHELSDGTVMTHSHSHHSGAGHTHEHVHSH
ncbi:hypothetical protein FACS1894167_08820 [Synergistales bacterium]|nr:hypothetical protein FACS1894167_08820 [Synergistales bacterium]